MRIKVYLHEVLSNNIDLAWVDRNKYKEKIYLKGGYCVLIIFKRNSLYITLKKYDKELDGDFYELGTIDY